MSEETHIQKVLRGGGKAILAALGARKMLPKGEERVIEFNEDRTAVIEIRLRGLEEVDPFDQPLKSEQKEPEVCEACE